ncbi:uncharacterized protein LOC124132875 isoform X2 [Haliotis rufescens]|uniref:uncharacterized protein LOC124132875 isoform X2 n=1 Tax=Haliotis rufescens TaxID=6454 RepID=UPI00201EB91D|nr:uncharacterized protein LOC124132875 isoform X2 [Haliotis rufescens]
MNRYQHLVERSMKCCHLYCLLTFLTFLSGITGARLTTSPIQMTIGGSSPTSQLTLSCSPDAPGITQVLSIEIGKKSSTGSNQPIIRMNNTDSSVQVEDPGLQQRMTASGSITGATGSIQFILTGLRCTDAASTYYCSTLYMAGGAGSDEATTNIKARTYPEQIEMFPSPDRVTYDEGQLISFRCTGRIGNQFNVNNLQNLWTWEWRSIDNEFTSWTRYPNDQNITYQPPTPVSGSGGCQYDAASTLLHTVSNQDNGREFRCSVINEDYSDNKTVFVIDARPSPPTDFYCTEHTASSVKMQWTFTDTRSQGYVFILSYWQKDSTVWSVTNVTADTGMPQTRWTLSVPRLQSDTLYYFRLLVDGVAGQSEAVTSTCFTEIDVSAACEGVIVG